MAKPTGASTSTSVTECRAFGVVPNSSLEPLAHTLRGLCSKYGDFKQYEAVLSIPGKSTNVKMLRRLPVREPLHKANPFLEKPPERWCMLWESDPLRGPLFKELPAAVREVCESYCFCDSAANFWRTLGANLEYDMIKTGNEYICWHQGFELRVLLIRIMALQQPGNPDSGLKNTTQRFVIDVSTRVPEGRHADGARALGAFGGTLQNLVSLQRADKPLG